MLDFIVNNYYVILVVCILLIFAIIGYIIDSLKRTKYENEKTKIDSYIPEEEIFIQKTQEDVEIIDEEQNINELLNDYNNEQRNENS